MKNRQFRELAVCGFETVRTLAERHPDRIQRLFFTQDRARFFGPICKQMASAKRVYRVVESGAELERLCQSVHHQGVVAMIAEPVLPRLDLETLRLWQNSRERVLVLDRVGNANNLGAIIRSAAFFGVGKIVIGENDEQAQITTSAYRVAQGGMEFVDVYRAPSAAWLVQACAGKMTRFGADHRARNRLSDIHSLSSGDKGVLIIMGNEESGLSVEVKTACDYLIRVPGSDTVESLNVAQAATLFLYELSHIESPSS